MLLILLLTILELLGLWTTDAQGIISTIAGTGSVGSTGDGGDTSSALLKNPSGLSVDALGNVYIADMDNHKIRKVRVCMYTMMCYQCTQIHCILLLLMY